MRRYSSILTGMVIFACWIMLWEPLAAERYRLRAKCGGERRLSAELVLVRRAKSHYKGICRDGKAVYEVADGQVPAVQTMAAHVDTDIPPVAERSTRLLISYADLNSRPSRDTLQAAGLNLIQDYEHGSFLIVEPHGGSVTAETVEALMADNAVTYAAPDYIMSVSSFRQEPSVGSGGSPNDPYLDRLWGMQNSGAAKVWPVMHDASNIIVGVIDTGVDYTHPDLRDNMWTRGGKHGYDFYENDDDPMDQQDHGTHCAGTIAGSGNNGVGVVGVCWKAQIMALRFLGPDGSGATSDAVRCIDWGVANGAHILSNSWGGPDNSPELLEAVARAERKGVLFIAAAGNTGGTGNNNDQRPSYPSSLPQANVISVGAIDVKDQRGSFSHYGRQSVDIGAPGVEILSTVRNNGYDTFSGTSMATPHVAGAAALVWASTFSSPVQDPTQMAKVRDLIYQNARSVPALREFWGYESPAKIQGGVLDLTFLLKSSPGDSPPGTGSPVVNIPRRRRIVENRMLVDPIRLQ
ncbi:MAG: S8 family serine peptidase [Planctomycetaceae bacterium]|nr:S8 family serine peptidase [Planctomycetaceae bacterium]